MPSSPPNLLVILNPSCVSLSTDEPCGNVPCYLFKGALFLFQSLIHSHLEMYGGVWSCVVYSCFGSLHMSTNSGANLQKVRLNLKLIRVLWP